MRPKPTQALLWGCNIDRCECDVDCGCHTGDRECRCDEVLEPEPESAVANHLL